MSQPFWMDEPPPDPEELPPDVDRWEESGTPGVRPRPATPSRRGAPRRAPSAPSPLAPPRDTVAAAAANAATAAARPATPATPATRRPAEELREEALQVLRTLTGRRDADFHPGQFEAIEALVGDHRRVMPHQP